MSHTRLRRPSRPFITPTLLDLPREVVRNIALHIYDPLELSQQDRLTWGIFSTVDMHEERQDALAALISFGKTCRKVRREVRVVQFRCIRTPTTRDVDTVVRNADNWAHYVRSIIIDLNMFDHDENGSSAASGSDEISRQPKRGRRTCWHESTLLTNLIQSLPNLNHISFFADASDDATLALLFASLIPHPSTHSIPPPTVPSSPSVRSTSSGYHPLAATPQPFASRVRSFGWRQRAAPPAGFRQFAQSSTFVAPLHLIRHAHRLSFLVLDADLQEMDKEDVLIACKDLSLRAPPLGEEAEKVSLMLWTFTGIKELFVDRPLRKSLISHETTFEDFTSLLEPLGQMPHLQLLQVGSYIFPIPLQTSIAFHLAQTVSSLLVLGLLGEEGETNWWGIWRNASKRVPPAPSDGLHDALYDVALVPLGDGHLRRLEIEGRFGGV